MDIVQALAFHLTSHSVQATENSQEDLKVGEADS
jgi:hypothetical protein